MVDLPDPLLSRRTLLAGGLALGATSVLAACGSSGSTRSGTASSDSSASGSPGSGSASATDLSKAQLVAFFGESVVNGIPQRLVFGLGDSKGALLDSGPASLTFTLHKPGSTAPIGQPIEAARHDKGLPRAYYPVAIDLPATGDYVASTTVGGHKVDAAFRLDDTKTVQIPQAGAPMPDIPTPTTTDAQGVDPICTANPQCPLHTTSLDLALKQNKPTALLISTPAFCQVAICGPVLNVLLSQQQAFGDRVQMIHAEVYKSGAQASEDFNNAQLSPTVEAFKLPFEPSLILAHPDGTIAERLDYIFDEGELQQALGRLVA